MDKIVEYIQQYYLVVAVLIVVILLLCWKNKEVRDWVLRLVVFALVLVAAYFVFQKEKYRLPSSGKQVTIRDDSITPEQNAGNKYYSDPAEDMKKEGL